MVKEQNNLLSHQFIIFLWPDIRWSLGLKFMFLVSPALLEHTYMLGLKLAEFENSSSHMLP